MPDRANLSIYQGDDYAAVVTVTNGLPPEEVLAGYMARAQIRKDAAEITDEILVDIGATVETPHIYLNIPQDETASLCSGSYVWDLEIVGPDGVITTILAGTARVTAEVTRV